MKQIDKDKAELNLRIFDLEMSLQRMDLIKPKLYYKLLPHLREMKILLKRVRRTK